MIDVCIVGAGPCGISCALYARKRGLSVALIECGRHYSRRKCLVDYGGECCKCTPCNVASGFGGCVHYGDSAKLSYYPSGKELYNKISKDYYRVLEEACLFWNVNINEFVDNHISAEGEPFEIKAFPVRVINSEEIKKVIEEKWAEINNAGIEYYNCEMTDFYEHGNEIDVCCNDKTIIRCKYIVLAMGRHGINWIQKNASVKNFEYEMPVSTVGFRFEMPRDYMTPLGRLHPDFKFRMEYKGYKYKSFCYCGGEHGGRLKFVNYGDYVLLDGHILTETDTESKYANFALLRQMIMNGEERGKVKAISDALISNYICKFWGNPIFQSYNDFKNGLTSVDYSTISAQYVKRGAVQELFDPMILDYCYVAEKVFGVIAQYADCSIDDIKRHTNVIGLELEGMWMRIKTDDSFRIKNRQIYIGGDCGGESQGIMQATIEGIRIARCLE